MTTTPGQTVGPFFGYALAYDHDDELVPLGSAGSVRLRGRVLDGAGDPVPDALLELWQTDPDGRVVQQPGGLQRRGGDFTGWGRASTDREGRYAFTTLTPGSPYFSITVFARGLLDRLFTRAYLPDAPDDALLASLPPDGRTTLRTVRDDAGYVFDVRLQGEGETVFLEFPTAGTVVPLG